MNTDWDKLASEIATALHADAFERHRGVLELDDRYVIFGNDGAGDPRTEKERELMRERLEKIGFTVIGEGTDAEPYTWVMIVEFDGPGIPVMNQETLYQIEDMLMRAALKAGFGNALVQRGIGQRAAWGVIERFAANV